jgi:probable HAF family extracellular repeat protein
MHDENLIRPAARARVRGWHRLSAAAFVAASCGLQAQHYAVTDLGTLGGTNCLAYGIDNREQIVGAAQTRTGSYHAFLFQGGRMMDLGTMGGSNSWAFGINGHGWIVGTSELWNSNRHAFLCTNALTGSRMMDLGTLGGSNSAARMVSMHGDIVGWASMSNGSYHAFFMTNCLNNSRMRDLGTAGGTNSIAYCINSNRMVVGYATMSDGTQEPIMSTNPMSGGTSMVTMGMGNMGAYGGQSWFVNEQGITAGEARMPGGNRHAVLSGSGGMMGRMNLDLGTLGGSNSIAYCVNYAGWVVGTAQLSNGTMHAFMFTNGLWGMGRMVDLNGLVPTNCGWVLREARGINDAGQIVGWGMRGGRTNGFLLTPVSGPVRIVSAPGAQVVGAGSAVRLTMSMSANEPLTYQWMHDGQPIPGATNSSLDLGGMHVGRAGRYSVVVNNLVGTVAGASADISVFGVAYANGTPRLSLAAPAGLRFQIQRSDVLGPAASWQIMTNFTMPVSMTQISDPLRSGTRARFYRAVMMP